MNRFLQQNSAILLFTGLLFLGGAAGYFYYTFVGCQTGTCPITSNPYHSTIWGLILGSALGLPALEWWFKQRNRRKN